LSRAEAAFAAGQYDKAEMDYRKVLSRAPEDLAALRQLGSIYVSADPPTLRACTDVRPDVMPDVSAIGLTLSCNLGLAGAYFG
jgi:Tetratricopeptide repeat